MMDEIEEEMRKFTEGFGYNPISPNNRYFDRKGNPISLMEFGKKIEDSTYKIVKQERMGEYFVSTVWTGINMNWQRGSKLIFETMIFVNDDSDEMDHAQWLYETEEEAIAGHEKAVQMVKGGD